jgi:glucose-6-phosphate 1-epimerase
VVERTALLEGGTVEITLLLMPNDTTRSVGYSAFQLRHRVTIGEELSMDLETRNDGGEPLVIEEALHTYFAVGNVRQASLTGLEGTVYIDKTGGFARKTLGNEPLRIAKETDEVHVNTQATCVIHDPVWNRRTVIEKSGSDSTVVWNPWIEKTAAMPDMEADGWTSMLCVESANAADNAVRLLPGQSHKLTVSISVK